LKLVSLPAYMIVDILLRSSGGAHRDSSETIDPYMTPCIHKRSSHYT